jgi:hypothetical protein
VVVSGRRIGGGIDWHILRRREGTLDDILLVTVQVETIVLAGQHHRAIFHQRDVEALRMFHLALQRIHNLSILSEDGQVEVVVIVRHDHLALLVDAHADGIVGNSLATNLTQIVAFIAEHLNAMSTIVADEDFVLVVRAHPVGEFQIARAAELLEDIAERVEDDHAHDLALNNNNTALMVDTHATGVLQNVRTEFTKELSVLVVDLNLVGGRALRHNKVARDTIDGNPIGIKQLSVAFAALSKLEFESAFLVEHLEYGTGKVCKDK